MTQGDGSTPIIADTIVAVPDQIRALAKWFTDSLGDPQGLFQIGTNLLSALKYDLADEVSSAGFDPSSTPSTGILPGWCDSSTIYWPNAANFKSFIDKQLKNLYDRLVESQNADITTSIWQLFKTLSDTLTSIADDYDKGSSRITEDLNNLDQVVNGSIGGGSQ